jgi:hypothetical protein
MTKTDSVIIKRRRWNETIRIHCLFFRDGRSRGFVESRLVSYERL